jgi:SAM-dependent methyltransferase
LSCCNSGLNEIFTDANARKDAKRYRRRGLPARARKLVRAIESATQLSDKSTLEIGVGAGALTVELLRRGAAKATGVDAVPAQLAAARALANEYHVGERMQLIEADFAQTPSVEAADIVVLDRVVCCYSDWSSLLSAAAVRTRAVLVMSYPRDVWWMHATERAFNGWRGMLRSDFRFHVHSAERMHKLLDMYNLTPTVATRHFGWEILVAKHR